MNRKSPPFPEAAASLLAALRRETELARLGAVSELAQVADAKRQAAATFDAAWQERGGQPTLPAERHALRQVIDAANENALMLEAVLRALEDLPRRLRDAVAAAADPGTYSLNGRRNRHLLAARIDACA